MKNKNTFFGIIALAVVIIFSMIACDNGSGTGTGPGAGAGAGAGSDPTSVTYTSYDEDGNSYTLEIGEITNRAASYSPRSGDTFTLTVKNPAGTIIAQSRGTARTINGLTITLTQTGGASITITVTSYGTIKAISGKIPRTGGRGPITNPSFGDLSGKYYVNGTEDEFLSFSGTNFFHERLGVQFASGTYTVEGNILTLNYVSVDSSNWYDHPGAIEQITFSFNGGDLIIGNSTLTRNPIPLGARAYLSGTYHYRGNQYEFITFSGNGFSYNLNGSQIWRGTYTLFGSILTMELDFVDSAWSQAYPNRVRTGVMMRERISFNGNGDLIFLSETWTKQ